MTVRVRISPTATDRIRFSVSPLLEALASLAVSRAPQHHPLSHGWLRTMHELPAALRRDLARFAVGYQGGPTAFGLPLLDVERPSFDDELALLRSATPKQARRYFIRAHTMEELNPDGTPHDVAAQLIAYTRKVKGSMEVAEQALVDPQATLQALADVLERYWNAAFADYWTRSLPRYEQSIDDARAVLQGGVYALLNQFWPEVRIDPSGDTFSIKREHEHEIEITSDRHILLLPSFFSWPRIRAYCEHQRAFVITFPPLAMLARIAPANPPADLVALLSALSDETRLRAMRFLRGRARSTQELAALVGASEPTLSQHLRKLETAGILRSSREGYYVLYELTPSLGEEVRSKLEDYLGLAGASGLPTDTDDEEWV